MPLQSLVLPLLSHLGLPRRKILPGDVLSVIVKRAQECILVADIGSADARIIYVNSAFEMITGHPRQQVVGKHCRYLQGSNRIAARDRCHAQGVNRQHANPGSAPQPPQSSLR